MLFTASLRGENMIGRVREIKELNRLYSCNKAELVAIYGRRRVGKTYLVDETFSDRITFRHAGLSPADEDSKGLLKLQLNHFYNSLELQGMEKCDKPTNWFNLKECEDFYKSNNVTLSRYDVAQSYMVLGGIPYYMGYVNPGMSLAQNIDNMFFKKNAILRDEYNRLFASVFVNPEAVKKIVQLLFTRNAGFTRKEIVEKLEITDGGRLSSNLNALISSDFITKYVPFGYGKREEHYKLVDPFCMFYLHFIWNQKNINEKFWQQNVTVASVAIWRGFAFENVCFNHVEQIKRALGISGVVTEASAWSKKEDDTDGTQIDLLISRNDNVINMCEIKYYSGEFKVNKEYYLKLLKRQTILGENVSPKIAVHNTLITTFGLLQNEYSGVFTNVITLDDLFKQEYNPYQNGSAK